MPIIEDHEGAWSYLDGFYVRYDRDGYENARLNSEYLTDPIMLWEHKCAAYQVPNKTERFMNGDALIEVKPHPVTFALWEHKHAVSND